jgi:predicted  nucleic acid-binding Zn-ribbon protein
MDIGTISTIKDYAGPLISLAILLVAVSVLPGRIKYYVLTAGLAAIGYELWVRSQNRKLLAEADAEREALRSKVEELNKKGEGLEKTLSDLNRQLDALNARKAALDQRNAMSTERHDEANARMQIRDESAQQVIDEIDKLLEQVKGGQSALDILQEANLAYEEVQRIKNKEK